MEDNKKKYEEVLKKLDEVIKGLEEAQQDAEEESEEGSEEEFDFDAIDAELADIIDRLKGHEDRSRGHAYIIGFRRGNSLELDITGDGTTLKAMFCALWDQKPFCDIAPMKSELHKALKDFVEEIK